jgi:RNA polymerase sigma-70 factor (ECF subfamily)
MGFFFRQLDRNEAVAADFTQDAFMRIWTARDKFTGTNFRTWLFTIAFNLVKNHYRHAEHQQHYEQFLALHQAVTEDSNVVETLDGEAIDRALKQELERMSPDALLLFSLRFEEELSVPQIAEVMAIPEGTVKSRLHTLTQTLKKKLNPS